MANYATSPGTFTADEINRLERAKIGRRWTHPGTSQDRWYFDAERVWPLDVSRYKTGNISYSRWRGEKISHNQAGRLAGSKIWIDHDGALNLVTYSDQPGLLELAEQGIRDALANAKTPVRV
jgi:hypothetical protein